MREIHDDVILQLEDCKQDLFIPDELDEVIRVGVQKGQREKQKRIKRTLRWLYSATTACIFVLAFVGTIRFSPAFAAILREIPGLEGFVQLIQKGYDSSVYMAVDQDLIQPIGESDTHDGITFTVDGILADESRMVLFYSVTGERNGNFYYVMPKIFDVNGQQMDVLIKTDHPSEKEKWMDNPYASQQGIFDIYVGQGRRLPDEVLLQVQMSDLGYKEIYENSPVFEVRIPIDHQFFTDMKEEYMVGKTIEVEGQIIYIDKVIHHPLTTEVHLEYDENNTMHIFSPVDMYLEDENGEIYHLSYEANSGTNNKVLYFTSNYFRKSKQLWLAGEMFRAVEKENMVVVVDTENQEMIKAPDHRIQLAEVTTMENDTRLAFLISDIDEKDSKIYTMFDFLFKDALGNVYSEAFEEGKRTMKTMKISDQAQKIYYYIGHQEYVQPLTFTIYDYPNYIHEPYRIQIK